MARFIYLLAALVALAYNVSAKTDKIVCYYGSWSIYRPGDGKFTVANIDPHKCTHAIYSFVGINSDGTIKLLDSWNDIDLKGLKHFKEMKKKNPKLKVMVAIGGWSEGSTTFSKVAGSSAKRKTFAKSALTFMQTHGFDGFDLDWEYPAQRGGASADKKNVISMLKTLRETFDASGKKYVLSAAVAADADSVDKSYDVPAFAKHLDFINLMAYDFHGSFDGETGLNAPLHSKDKRSVSDAVQGWLNRGAPAKKLILGLAVYGRSFTVKDSSNIGSNNGIGHKATAGKKGPFTEEDGYMGYLEICLAKKKGGWKEAWNNEAKVPSMYKGNQWIGFDNERSIRMKVEYAVKMKLGGAMIWSIDTDDHKGLCGKKWPILSTINEVIFGKSN